jgi:hypothetical protein
MNHDVEEYHKEQLLIHIALRVVSLICSLQPPPQATATGVISGHLISIT